MSSTQALLAPATKEKTNPGTIQYRPPGKPIKTDNPATQKGSVASWLSTIREMYQDRG